MFRPTRTRSVFALVAALMLILTLGMGGLAHSLIPHMESTHEEMTDILHSALSHEQKKFFFTLAMILGLGLLFVYKFRLVESETVFAYVDDAARRKPDRLTRALRRGTLAYRKFR